MWLARCSYIAKLVDPYALARGELPGAFSANRSCKGFGRYFFESWVYTHPSVRPCDLYPGRDFTWSYEHVPSVDFVKELRAAPRFDFDTFAALQLRRGNF
jgi:hypothetical protein